MSASFGIRPVRKDEYAIAGDIVARAYAAAARDAGVAFEEQEYDGLRDVAARVSHSLVLVSTSGARVVGSVTYVGDESSPLAEFDGGDTAGIRMLAVDPELQKQGIAQALVTECVARALSEGKKRIVLHTLEWMTGARRLYESFGFLRTPELNLEFPGLHLMAFVKRTGNGTK